MTRVARALAALAAAIFVTAAPAASPAAKATASSAAMRDWTRVYTVTPDGGMRLGNPSAKVAIVEYASLTCPHCRHFAATAMKPLIQNYVRSGVASYEYRSLILNGFDLAATLVARCNGPARFFATADKLYATQPMWIARADKLSSAEWQRLQSLPQGEMMVEMAKVTGILPLAAATGIAPARAQRCLRDPNAAARLSEMYRAAKGRGVNGTPTFFVNGKQVAGVDWATLEPRLKDALDERG